MRYTKARKIALYNEIMDAPIECRDSLIKAHGISEAEFLEWKALASHNGITCDNKTQATTKRYKK